MRPDSQSPASGPSKLARLAREGIAGIARDEVDGARESVAAEIGVLRAAQHLDAFDVAGVDGIDAAQNIVAIDEHGTGLRARQRDGGLQAAEGQVGHETAGAVAAGRLEEHVGRELDDVADVVDARLFDRLGREGRDGNRDILHGLCALARRDSHFLEPQFGGLLLRMGGQRGQRDGRGKGERNGSGNAVVRRH